MHHLIDCTPFVQHFTDRNLKHLQDIAFVLNVEQLVLCSKMAIDVILFWVAYLFAPLEFKTIYSMAAKRIYENRYIQPRIVKSQEGNTTNDGRMPNVCSYTARNDRVLCSAGIPKIDEYPADASLLFARTKY